MEQIFYSETSLNIKAKESFSSKEQFNEYVLRELSTGFTEPIIEKAEYTKKFNTIENTETHRFEVVILSPDEYKELNECKDLLKRLYLNNKIMTDYFTDREE